MPIGTAFLRIFAALVLSIPFFLALSFYLGAASAEDTLLDADFVTDSFERVNLYERIYSEVFLRREFSDWADILTGDFQVSDEEKAQLLKNSIPPAYVETETERNVSETLEFLNSEDNQLDVFIHLDTPLGNAKSTAFDFLDRSIDGLDSVPVAGPEELSEEIAAFLAGIGNGQIPSHIPSDEGIAPEERGRAYQRAFNLLEQNGSVSPAALANLRAQESAILSAIREGGTREGLKLASRSVVEPRLDEEIASLRQKSGPEDQLDLVEQLAESSDRTPDRVLRDARILRFVVGAATGEIAQWTALAIAALSILAMAAIFVPYWKHVIFWPSLTLLVGGVLLLLIAFSTVLDSSALVPVVCTEADPESCRLVLDIGQNIAAGVAAMFADAALKIIVAGGAGLFLSLVVSTFLRRKAS
jgi:hypothetical protein